MTAARFASGALLVLMIVVLGVALLAGTAGAQTCDTATAAPDTGPICADPTGVLEDAGGADGGAGGGTAVAASRIDAGVGGVAAGLAQVCDTGTATPDTTIACEGSGGGPGRPVAGGAVDGGEAVPASRIDAGGGASSLGRGSWAAAVVLAAATVTAIAVRRRAA